MYAHVCVCTHGFIVLIYTVNFMNIKRVNRD